MLRKVLATTLSVILIFSILSIAVTAAPYKELKVGEGVTVIEAVWFDSGEENYGENDGGGNHDMRPDETMATYDYTINGDYAGGRETDTPSCIGWISADEWVQYTIQVQVAGKYSLGVWGAAGPGGDFVAYYNGEKIGSAYIEDMGGWHDYVLYPVGNVDMTVGTHVIRTDWPDGGINVESLVFTLLEAAAPPPAPEPAPAAVVEAAPAPAPAPVVAAAPAPVAAATAPRTGNAGFAVLAVALIGACVITRRVTKR